jgi:hypothetical protein
MLSRRTQPCKDRSNLASYLLAKSSSLLGDASSSVMLFADSL